MFNQYTVLWILAGLAAGGLLSVVVLRMFWRERIAVLRERLDQYETMNKELAIDLSNERDSHIKLETELQAERKAAGEKLQLIEKAEENLKNVFGSLSAEALKSNSSQFLELAKTVLEKYQTEAKGDIDQRKQAIENLVKPLAESLEKYEKQVREMEEKRSHAYGDISRHLLELGTTTNSIREALAHSKTRGQWGERMAEDVLRLAGFVENVNYMKQKAFGSSGTIPDFTFLLPRNLFLNMDVKFPLDNYMRYLDAGNEAEKESYKRNFLRDVRTRIQEITSREYINPEMNTVDYVLLFIPNEQIYGFIQEEDRTLFDMSLKNRVIVCSPLTLFAVLAVIRAAVDNFALEQKANRMLSLFGAFKTQWGKFVEGLEKVGKRIEAVQKEYDSLNTTRRRQLERPLADIDMLREQQGLAVENYLLEIHAPEQENSIEDDINQ